MSENTLTYTQPRLAEGALMSQRLASQHFPRTWTDEDQFDRDLWTWHDAHHEPTRYAVCPICCAEMEAWQEEELAKKVAVYNIATELGL